MEIYCTGTARIRHNATGEIYEIESNELDWDAVGGDERRMGSEIHYEAVIDHPDLGELTLAAVGVSGRYRESSCDGCRTT